MKNKGINEIEPYLKIGHNPTIGDMYEGLTKQLMERTIFKGLNMNVVSGKITNDTGDLSKQIDCMIVMGEGTNIPYTDEYIYNVSDVIAVIEVKKNLFANELSDAYDNLKSVTDIAKPKSDMRINMLRDAFTGISKMPLPEYEKVNKLGIKHQMLYHSLICECFLPIRVIFGYEGFASESSLRNKFIEFLSAQINQQNGMAKGFGAVSLPNLIIAKENSLIKTNGMPYTITFEESDDYCWIASYRKNPLLLFLELLWTRLTYFYDIPTNIFGDSLTNESLMPLLEVCGKEHGWEYRIMQEESFGNLDDDVNWSPSIVSHTEFVLLNELCTKGSVYIDKGLEDFIDSQGEELQYIIRHLNSERLVYCENNVLKLLTKNCKCVVVPNFGYCAADDYDGRFSRWISQYMAEKRK
jgi:hypothetical protein